VLDFDGTVSGGRSAFQTGLVAFYSSACRIRTLNPSEFDACSRARAAGARVVSVTSRARRSVCLRAML